jgi:hypothetical protein
MQVNTEKNNDVFVSHQLNTEKITRRAVKSFESMEILKYLKRHKNNSVREEIKRKLNFKNAYRVQSRVFCLLVFYLKTFTLVRTHVHVEF